MATFILFMIINQVTLAPSSTHQQKLYLESGILGIKYSTALTNLSIQHRVCTPPNRRQLRLCGEVWGVGQVQPSGGGDSWKGALRRKGRSDINLLGQVYLPIKAASQLVSNNPRDQLLPCYTCCIWACQGYPKTPPPVLSFEGWDSRVSVFFNPLGLQKAQIQSQER